jgi:hypothetical protein
LLNFKFGNPKINKKLPPLFWGGLVQRVANMARSRSLAKCFLITRIFMLLLICLNNTKAAMGYYLLLAVVIY